MLTIQDRAYSLCDGLSRREWLRIGGIGLGGLSLPGLLASRARANSPEPVSQRKVGKAKAVIVFGLIGGPGHHETWDPKPQAPAEIRGAFGRIATRTPGLFVGELMPRTAQLTDKIAVLRALATNDNAHSSSGYQMFTGMPHQPLNQESATPRAPNNWPCLGGLIRALKPDRGRLPSAITLPEHIWNDGNFPWPGQDAGFLGTRHHPWLIHCDPANSEFRPPDLTLSADIPALRFDGRRSLLGQVNHHLDHQLQTAAPEHYSQHAQRAFDLLASGAARRAFDLDQEPARMRERYGKTRFAQSILLARRLIEAGVTLVQVNWTRIKDQPNQGGWDTHATHNQAMQNLLMPIMDQAYSALLEDLQARGLLDETLVVWFGEFGRTPRFNGNAGRDHWGHCFSLALAGGGIRGGVVHGSSDRIAGYPQDGRVEPRDFLATIFHCLGYHPDTEVLDVQNRPIPISRGTVLEAVL
jgi:hypothetical protein